MTIVQHDRFWYKNIIWESYRKTRNLGKKIYMTFSIKMRVTTSEDFVVLLSASLERENVEVVFFSIFNFI